MLQEIYLTSNTDNQFLGDLFEGFLDDGVKQNEGQFFTPLPITRFIVSSLPLEKMINDFIFSKKWKDALWKKIIIGELVSLLN